MEPMKQCTATTSPVYVEMTLISQFTWIGFCWSPLVYFPWAHWFFSTGNSQYCRVYHPIIIHLHFSRIYAKILETRKLRERCQIKKSNNIPLVPQKSIVETKDNPENAIVSATVTVNNVNANENNSPVSVEAQTQAANTTSQPVPKRHEAMSTKDFKMARVLLSIVLVFFVCHLPR